jgi:chemotaxis protein MotB
MMKKKKEKKENSERWMLTYSDLITLLMVFFIVLYSMSNINKDQYQQLAKSLENALGSSGTSADGSIIPKGSGILNGGTGLTSSEIQENGATEDGKSAEDNFSYESDGISKEEFIELRTSLYNAIKDSDLKDTLKITVEDKGMVITLPNDILFGSGEAEVRSEMKPILDKVAQLINSIDSPVQIEGYTDNVPVNTIRYKSNWQLSAERAANVVYYLVDNYNVKPERLTASAHGENNPVASNKTANGRMRNRRISITILYNKEPD